MDGFEALRRLGQRYGITLCVWDTVNFVVFVMFDDARSGAVRPKLLTAVCTSH